MTASTQRVRNVSTSCEVLWISRQSDESIRSFFKGAAENTVRNTTLSGIFGSVVGAGSALWLSNDATLNVNANANYVNLRDNSDVIACSWSKEITAPAGQFSVQVKPRIDYDELIKPGDIFVIFMDNDHRVGSAQRTAGTLVTIGIIDRVSKVTSASENGATVSAISITGRDLGSVFEETQTVFDPAFAVIDQQFFDSEYITRAAESDMSALSPVENVLRLLDLIYRYNATKSKLVGGQWTLPNTQGPPSKLTASDAATILQESVPVTLLSLINVTAFIQVPMYGYSLAQSPGITQAGNVWALISGFANRLVNEFFVDVRDFTQDEVNLLNHLGSVAKARMDPEDVASQELLRSTIADAGTFNQSTLETDISGTADDPSRTQNNPPLSLMSLVLRQQPLDRDAFDLLPVNDLDHQEVFDYEVAFATHEVVNFFKIGFPDLGPVAWELIYGIKINLDSIPKYGIRRLEVQTKYSFATSKAGDSYADGDSTEGVFGEVYRHYIDLLSTWYAANELFLAGAITCRFRPEIRIGTRLRYRRLDGRILSFYVNAVNHSFGVSAGQSRTQLTVVRGRIDGENDLPNNLIWKSNGSGIPPGFVNWGVSRPDTGMTTTGDQDERTVKNQQEPVDAISGVGTVVTP